MSQDCEPGLLAWLAHGTFAGAQAGPCECFETHASLVFVSGDCVLKIKKPVDLGYLDFSTLNKRQAACRREYEINVANAPSLYRGVRAITRDAAGRFNLDGHGVVVEWAVEMGRFEQGALLSARISPHVADGKPTDLAPLGREFFTRLAHVIAGAHQQAPVNLDVDLSDELAHFLSALHLGFERHHNVSAAREAKEVIRNLRDQLGPLGPCLQHRAAKGFVRRCHGDLHLNNIVVVDGEPVLFDAIEFDDAVATVDVLNDLAFVLMDLWHHGAHAAANGVLNAYLTLPGMGHDALDGLSVLPLYMNGRALIRALVLMDRARQSNSGADEVTHLPPSQKTSSLAAAGAYVATAQRLGAPEDARLIAIGGRSGTGKTTLARALAAGVGKPPGAVVLRSDVIRKQLFGKPDHARLGPDAYTPAVSAKVYQLAFDAACRIIQAGHSAIIDAAFLELDQRDAAHRIATANGGNFQGLWLEGSADVLSSRIEARRNDASDATVAVLRQQLSRDPGPFDSSWQVLNTDHATEHVTREATVVLNVAPFVS